MHTICVAEAHVCTSLDVVEETSTIVANVAELLLDSVVLSSPAFDQDKIAVSQDIDTAMERVSFTFDEPIPSRTKAKLVIEYHGNLTGSLSGYYKSSLVQDGTKVNYALTQFEVCLPTTLR